MEAMYVNQFVQTTHDVRVMVLPLFLHEQSHPAEYKFVWAYSVTIENLRKHNIKLISRRWRVVNDMGDVKEVQGPGVVGQQPIIKPAGEFQYTSGTALNTPTGMMMGSYQILDFENNQMFEVEIPVFSLDSPFDEHQPS
jgi:ApaG protein